MEKSAALAFFVGAKNSAAFMKKGGMTDAIFSTSFCITDSVGGITIPAGETERRA